MRIVFNNEKQLERYIRDHTREIFGEQIWWIDDYKSLPGESGHPIIADLAGQGEDDGSMYHVIAEVKLLRPRSERKYDLAREAVGQVLHYAYAYISDRSHTTGSKVPVSPSDDLMRFQLSDMLRLFIVGEEFSQPVGNICRILRVFGINIQHRYVNQGDTP